MDGNLEWLSRTMSASIVTITGSTFVLGNLNVSDGITGSLFGTSSWAYSSSVAISSSFSITSSYSVSSSLAQNAITSSYPLSITGSTLYSTAPATSLLSANNVIALGTLAGYQATLANNSNFFGANAGQFAIAANNSNFLGLRAGYQATSASNSNFFGQDSGYQTTFANDSNFIGSAAGLQSTSASYSNFVGYQSGYQAILASYSNFIGYKSGFRATSASYSILIGYNVGNNTVPTIGIGSNNIIIGTNITLADNTSNAINIGGIIFGRGSHSEKLTNPFSGSVNGKIGINNPNPIETLDISGSLKATSSIYFPGVTNSTYPYLVSVDTASGKLYYTNQFTGSLFGTASQAVALQNTGSPGFVSNMSDTYTSTAKITDIITLSAAEYAAIGSPLTSTLYVII